MSCKTCKDQNCVCNDRVLSVTIGVPGPKGNDAGVGNISGWKIIEYKYTDPFITEMTPGTTGNLLQYSVPKTNLTDQYDQVRITYELDSKQKLDLINVIARSSYPDGLPILDSNGNTTMRGVLAGSAWVEIAGNPIYYAGTQQIMDFNASTAYVNARSKARYLGIIHLTRLTNTTMLMDWYEHNLGVYQKRFTLPSATWQTGGLTLASYTVPDLDVNDLQFVIKADNTGNIGSIVLKRLIVEAKNNF